VGRTWFCPFKELYPGLSFGELAMISAGKRAATIKCIKDCSFAVMKKEDYQRVLLGIQERTKQKTNQFLRDLPFFQQNSNSQLQKLMLSFEIHHYKRNQVVFKEGATAGHVYLVREGDFECTKQQIVSEKAKYKFEKLIGPKKTITQQKIDQS